MKFKPHNLIIFTCFCAAFATFCSCSDDAKLDLGKETSRKDLESSEKRTFRRAANADQTGGSDMIVHEREFVSPQVRVQMDCQREKTQIKINFSQPFNGILGAGKLETTECRIQGNGTRSYVLQVPHNATTCDTHWDNSTSSIFNTLFIRFHSSLETGSDIAKNIMCRLTVGDLFVGGRSQKKKTQDSNLESFNLKPGDE